MEVIMRKYDMRICKCGRIHMIEMDKLYEALHNNKNLLLICAGCGKATNIGADIEPDYIDPSKDCYNMYSFEFSNYKDAEIKAEDFETSENHKGIQEIIYSHGHKVPMMTGMYATDYNGGRFSDRWYPDFYKIQRNNVTIEEIMKFIDEYTHDRTTVNMSRFIYETPDDILEEISHYHIPGFNFKGTRYETEWNSK